MSKTIGYTVGDFFRKRYAVQMVLHLSSNIPMAGYLFFAGSGLPLFSVFSKREKEVNIFGGIIPLFHAGGAKLF